MSRALGDKVGRMVGVSDEADVNQIKLTENDRWVVMASDGVWEFMEEGEVGK
jgi:serine/threonine protein phosphatase PrpC